MEEVIPAIQGVPGMRSAKVYAGVGGLCADMRSVFTMDGAGVYESFLATPALQPRVAKTYAAWKMSTASQTFVHAVTPEILRALSRTCAMVCLVVHTVIWRPSVTRRGGINRRYHRGGGDSVVRGYRRIVEVWLERNALTCHRVPTPIPFQAVCMRGRCSPACMDDGVAG